MNAPSHRIRAVAVATLIMAAAASALSAETGKGGTNLAFDPTAFTTKTATVNGKAIGYRAFEGILYARNPADPKYETLNFYVPLEYFQGKQVNGYSIATAPIFLPNTVGGYMPGAAGSPGAGFDGKPNAALVALSRGLVVACPGARGRSLTNASGAYTGKAPAAIVDLKAAVRYLRANDALMPGDAEKIVSDGTSAGGALSALLGASGDNADYEAALKALGAADARDDIFAVSAYCPIMNLDNADSAYEWLLGSLKETKDTMPGLPGGMGPGGPGGPGTAGEPGGTGLPMAGGPGAVGGPNPFGAPASQSGPMSAQQIAVSAQLAALFPAYLNSLGLKKIDGSRLSLDATGKGSFKDYLTSFLIASAQTALKQGADFSKIGWVAIKKGTVTDIDWNGYLQHCGRKKAAPAFDGLDLSSGENNLFGDASIDNRHFTAFGQANDTAAGTLADPVQIRMMNPMAYIGVAGTTSAKYWRIRHGTVDSDTALPIPVILAAKLANSGFSVDFALPWERPHSGDYDLDELFAWIDSVCR